MIPYHSKFPVIISPPNRKHRDRPVATSVRAPRPAPGPSFFRSIRYAGRVACAGFFLGLHSISPGQAILLNPNDPIEPFDNFGSSVAIDGNTIVVGKNGDNEGGLSGGAAYIFEAEPEGSNNWVQRAKIFGDTGGNFDHFGDSAAIEGDVLAVGATGDDDVANNAGAVYIFERDAGGADQWGQVAKLTAGDGGQNQGFGYKVDLSGDRMVVGAFFATDLAENFGTAYVFEKEGGQWVQKARLTPENPQPRSNFGKAVAISGEIAVVGANAADFVADVFHSAPGFAYIFERNAGGDGNWGQTAQLSENEVNDSFGTAVGIRDEVVAVGAPGHSEGGLSSTGAVYIFERNAAGQFEQTAKVIPTGVAERDAVGSGVALSGNALVAGASGSEANNFAAAGVAYVFERQAGGQWSQVAKLNLESPQRSQQFGRLLGISGGQVVGSIVDINGTTAGMISATPTGGGAFTFSVPITPPPPPPPPPDDEDIFSGGPDLGGGWHESAWFGFYNTEFDPWIFHAEHGWTFVDASSTPEGMFLFDLSSGGWFFSGEALYPNLFSFGRNSWVFYFAGTSNPRNYVDLGSGEFFNLE